MIVVRRPQNYRTTSIIFQRCLIAGVHHRSPSSSQQQHRQHCLFSSLNGEEGKEKNPLLTIQNAMASLDEFSERLQKLRTMVDQRHSVPTVILPGSSPATNSLQSVSLAQMVLHSRDCPSQQEFDDAASARRVVLPVAIEVSNELKELADIYTSTLQHDMMEATRICQESPCGGLSWELQDIETLANNPNAEPTTTSSSTTSESGNQKIEFKGIDSTPCGRLQIASMNFLQTTYDTKPQIVMGSRAQLILELAHTEFNKPLRQIRESGSVEDNKLVRTTFQSQVISTPFLRSDEEYQQLLQIQQELK